MHLTLERPLAGAPRDLLYATDGERAWPVYLVLDRTTGVAWVQRYESGKLPTASSNGLERWFRIAGTPTPDEAARLLEQQKTLLEAELAEPWSRDEEIQYALDEFVPATVFATAREYDQEADFRGRRGEQVNEGEHVSWRHWGGEFIVNRRTTNAGLVRYAALVENANTPELHVGRVLEYLTKIRDTCLPVRLGGRS